MVAIFCLLEDCHFFWIPIQTFSEVWKGNYVYIEKTVLVWKTTQMKYVFLSCLRKFGKNLFATTLDSCFKGRKDLFEGLDIRNLETEWECLVKP